MGLMLRTFALSAGMKICPYCGMKRLRRGVTYRLMAVLASVLAVCDSIRSVRHKLYI